MDKDPNTVGSGAVSLGPVGSLDPVALPAADRGTQFIIHLPASSERHLAPGALDTLQERTDFFVHGVLREAQRLAAQTSEEVDFKIEARDILHGESTEVARLRPPEKRRGWLAELFLAAFGVIFGVALGQQPNDAVLWFVAAIVLMAAWFLVRR